MPRDEDESNGEGEPIPIREIVPLPPGFPDDVTDRVDAGDVSDFEVKSRPTGSRAANACDNMVGMIMVGQFISDYDSKWMMQEREMMLPKLRDAYDHLAESDEATPKRRLVARRFLWLLGAPEGSRWMAEDLEVGQPEKNKRLDDLRHFVISHCDKIPVVVDEPLLTTLRQCWQDPETRDDALSIGLGLDLSEARDALLKAVIDPGKFPGISGFGNGWSVNQQETAIQAISKRLETSDKDETGALLRELQSTWIEPVEEAAVSPQMQQLAIQVAEDFLLNPARPYRDEGIAVLRYKGSVRCLEEAERVAYGKKDSMAIMLYARLAGDRLRPDFIELLNEPRVAVWVIKALTQVPASQLPPSWVAPIAAQLKGGIDQKKDVLKVLARMGRAGVEEARKHCKTLPMQLVWVERGLTLQAAANDLARLGLADSPPVIDPSLDPIDSEGLRNVLFKAGILFDFDAEYDFIPPPHHALLTRAAASSRGKFAPLHPRQFWRKPDDKHAGYIVEFAQDGKLIRFSAGYLGDWYDVMAVLKGANFALEKKNLPDRFVVWEEEDQVCTVVFGPLDKLQEFARLYALPLDVSSADLTEESNEDNEVSHDKLSRKHDEMIAGLLKQLDATAKEAKNASKKKSEDQGSLLIRVFGFLVIALIISTVRWCSHH